MTKVWLGVDLGTTGTRCLAFDAELNTLATAYRENPPDYGADGVIEQDPESWFDTTISVIAQVASQVNAGAVEGLAITSQGITIVPVRADGTSLRPAISWLDLRGEAELPELARHRDPADLMRSTGKPFAGAYSLPKLIWLARHEPDVLAAARWVLMPMDYLHLRFTGHAVTDHTMASGTMAYDLVTQSWDAELLTTVGVDPALMPKLAWSGSEVGRLLPAVAARMGLPEVPVFVGGQDQKCAAHAAGIGPGITTLSLGTSAALESLSRSGHYGGMDIYLFIYLAFVFLGPHLWHMEVPRLGVESEL